MERESSPDTCVSVEDVQTRLREQGLDPRWSGGRRPSGFTGFTDDSRDVEDGFLFCAVRGFETDGHRFLQDARAAGAAAAVVESAVDVDGALPQIVVSDTRAAAAHLASLFHGDPSRRLRVAGVTGTDGKTTTAWLLRHLFGGLGPAASVGTLGVVGPDGGRSAGDLTTPGPVDLAAALAGLRDRGVERVALEVSSHALDQRRADGVELKGLALTTLSREHLDYHRDMEAYRAAKLRSLDLLAPDGVCAVNADEEAWEGVAPPGRATLTYGLGRSADVRARDVRSTESGTRWRLSTPDGSAEVRLPLPGRFNVHNALAAAALAVAEGMEPGAVARRLSRSPQVPGRMEVLRREPALVVRDYAHTPEALRRVLAELRPGEGRLVVVFGCGGDRDAGKRPLMGRAAAEGADRALVTTDNPRSEDPGAIAREVMEGIRSSASGDAEVILDRRAAIARALEESGPGDVVLLAGKGHETYQAVDGRKIPFDEARVVAELAGEEPAPDGDGPGAPSGEDAP